MNLKIKKGDNVIVTVGKDKDKTGRVLKVYPEKMKILVEQVNISKRHTRPNQKNQKGGIISKEMPIDYSNVQLLDTDNQPTRINIDFEQKAGTKIKIRKAKTNGKVI
jgi:large subunit ribosomal protein L24